MACTIISIGMCYHGNILVKAYSSFPRPSRYINNQSRYFFMWSSGSCLENCRGSVNHKETPERPANVLNASLYQILYQNVGRISFMDIAFIFIPGLICLSDIWIMYQRCRDDTNPQPADFCLSVHDAAWMTLLIFSLKVQSEVKRKWRSWTVNRYFAVDMKHRHPSLASSGVNGGTQLSILSKSSSQIRMSSLQAETPATWAAVFPILRHTLKSSHLAL